MSIIKSVSHNYSSRANPRRGYHDSIVVVTFNGGSEEDQLEKMKEIQADKAQVNMWSYPPKKVAENQWSVNYGYDSGD